MPRHSPNGFTLKLRLSIVQALLTVAVALSVSADDSVHSFPVEILEPQSVTSGEAIPTFPFAWWDAGVQETIMNGDQFVSFDLPTVLVDTLGNSPQIKSMSAGASIALEKTIQQDAAFDSLVLLNSRAGRTNDPVGNTLTTGGPDRLNESTLTGSVGMRRTTRSGTEIDLSQNLGFNDSNSRFFSPSNQANSRLSLSLNQPLYAGRGVLYNERLLTQARIESEITWQEMRQGVEERVAQVIETYWQLYERRCHLLQIQNLLRRSEQIEQLIEARQSFDAGPLERAKIKQRIARRRDDAIAAMAQVMLYQTRLASLTGAPALSTAGQFNQQTVQLELIPRSAQEIPRFSLELRDAVVQAIENRPEVRAAAADLESAGLSIQVSRNQLLPQLNAVVETYLAGLRGDNNLTGAFIGQLSDSGPGIAAGLQFERPNGQRAARSRLREAHFRYVQKSEALQEAILTTKNSVESALIEVERAQAQRQSKRVTLESATVEEEITFRRWELMAGDTSGAALVLDGVLDAQQRRTDAERDWTTANIGYRIALIQLERAMGTLLIHEGIQAEQASGSNEVQFIDTDGPSRGLGEDQP